MRARRRGPAAVLLLALAAAGCGSDGPIDGISSLNPFKKPERTLPGERRSVLPGTDPAAGVVNRAASIGAASALSDWAQPGGNTANDPGNIAADVTGARLWAVSAARSGGGTTFGISTGGGIRVSARPVAAGGVIYTYDPAGNVTAVAAANGGQAWRVNLRPGGESAAVNGGGLSVSGGRVYVATGFGEAVALDAGNGAVAWRTRIDAPARGAPTVAGGKVFLVTQAGTVTALDAGTGAQAWKASSSGSGTGLLASSSPAVAGNLVVAPASSGEVLAFDAATGAAKWAASVTGGSAASAITRLQDASASPVIHDGVVYATGVGGRMIAVSAATGETRWQQPIGGAHTPVVSGGAVFLIDLDNRMIAFDRAAGDPLWVTQLPAGGGRRTAWAGPVLVGGRLWAVSSDGRVLAVDAATGTAGTAGGIGIEGAIAPIVVGGRLVALGGEGTLVALQ